MINGNILPSCEQKHRWLVEYPSEGGLRIPSECTNTETGL